MRLVNFPVATDIHRCWNCGGSGGKEGHTPHKVYFHKMAGCKHR